MQTLRKGDKGDAVRTLQEALIRAGFLTGAADGAYGPGTEAAVRSLQQSRGLAADGIAGPRTLAALGLDDAQPQAPPVIPGVTVDKVCAMFPSTPRHNIETNLPTVLTELVAAALADKPMVLMALATIRAESEGFVPIDEGLSRFNTSPGGHPFDLYDLRADLGNNAPGDGERYRGRGFIQLTGKANYREHGQAIGLGEQLVTDPDQANDPHIAAQLLASFIKAKEPRIRAALAADDLRTARRLVNGGSHGLDRFSDCYNLGEKLLPA
ncbi:MAG: peptidoglycan-binding protein [Desulfobulbaceae bacterium]|nr:peptidoglycan-binding protein [Desulfobulbaceae bacterium]